mmetsp:Transcript_14009/g.38281  ORF Transcript_14009/g.38281 Transcript_14009/m.38281 type:complete len:150 (+) Transcript_14009:100-549(+)
MSMLRASDCIGKHSAPWQTSITLGIYTDTIATNATQDQWLCCDHAFAVWMLCRNVEQAQQCSERRGAHGNASLVFSARWTGNPIAMDIRFTLGGLLCSGSSGFGLAALAPRTEKVSLGGLMRKELRVASNTAPAPVSTCWLGPRPAHCL